MQEQKWETAADVKPIDPHHYAGINYGYIVRVRSGECAGVIGIAVMFSRFGDIGIRTGFPEVPCELHGYSFREQPENLEVLLERPLTASEFKEFQKNPERYKTQG